MDGFRRGGHLVPRRLVRHRDICLLQDVLAIEKRGALAVERRRVQLAVVLEPLTNARDHVVEVVVGVRLERGANFFEPPVLGPQRDFVHADGDQIELRGVGGDVRGDLVADLVFGQYQKVEGDARMR